MGISAAARSEAQSFDRTAADYDRLGDLSESDCIWTLILRSPRRKRDGFCTAWSRSGCGCGCQLESLGGTVIGLTWDSTL